MSTEPQTQSHEHGMSDAGYIKIALILAAITALEVSTYYVDFGPLFMPSLMIMMVVDDVGAVQVVCLVRITFFYSRMNSVTSFP